MGVKLNKNQITESLKPLGFEIECGDEDIKVTVPSWRAQDIDIPEDIVEEVARIYGYHNLPSNLMTGIIPDPLPNAPFEFESKIKNILKGWGGNEVYTMSMVAKENVSLAGDASWVVKLKNPLGGDSEYMQLSLAPSLVDAANANAQETNPFFLFEVANVYIPVRGELPDEQMTLAGIFSDYSWQEGKGIVEGLLEQMDIPFEERAEDAGGYEDHQRVEYLSGKNVLGSFGKLRTGHLYFEFDTQMLQKTSNVLSQFVPIPKYPPQVEDLNFSWPSKTLTGEVINLISKTDNQIISVELVDEYESSKTFRVTYQNPNKTLTNTEVEKLRNKILEKLNKKFGVKLKAQ